ncbi:hypothetical protein PHLGIDRAFT_80266, partial [Phlebiopsis gigantea 11061_1 CR5-6]
MESVKALNPVPSDISHVQRLNGEGKTHTQWKDSLQSLRQDILDNRANQVPRGADGKPLPSELYKNIESTANIVKVIDRSYLEHDCSASEQNVSHLITSTIAKFSLNDEQTRAFCIVANHATKNTGDHLKMYLGGMAGTGKSQVIKALVHFFRERKEAYRFMCLAPTGAAAALISGSTYHSILGFSMYDTGQKRNVDNAETNLRNVDYIFLDEVSMLDCWSHYRIAERMAQARKVDNVEYGG